MTMKQAEKRTYKDYEYMADNFADEHGGSLNFFGKATIAGMVILSDYYCIKFHSADGMDTTLLEGFKNNFPELEPMEYIYIAQAIRDYFLGSNSNEPSYRINLNKFKANYTMYKDYKQELDNRLEN